MFLTAETFGMGRAVDAGVVFSIVPGKRCVGVDDPKAMAVDFVCRTRLIRSELVNVGLGRKSDWIRLNVDGLGVVATVSSEAAICVVLFVELIATVANDARSRDVSRPMVS